jgi:hypothetical protein
MSELVAAGRMTEAERRYLPEKVGNLGGKRPDSGVLSLEHPYIIKHSGPIHYIKNCKGEIYVQVYLPKSKSETCKADTMRLSRNLSYMIKQQMPSRGNVDCTFKKFQAAGEASFEHHWNNHEHCGDWCQAKSWTEEEKVEKKGKFRDKVKNEREYHQYLKGEEEEVPFPSKDETVLPRVLQ